MFVLIKRFGRDESGAITVDWVVLTAALVGLVAAVIIPIAQQATDNSDSLGAYLEVQTINTDY